MKERATMQTACKHAGCRGIAEGHDSEWAFILV